jgi:hypothetical protein
MGLSIFTKVIGLATHLLHQDMHRNITKSLGKNARVI